MTDKLDSMLKKADIAIEQARKAQLKDQMNQDQMLQLSEYGNIDIPVPSKASLVDKPAQSHAKQV